MPEIFSVSAVPPLVGTKLLNPADAVALLNFRKYLPSPEFVVLSKSRSFPEALVTSTPFREIRSP